MSGPFGMSEDERKKISSQHKEATKSSNLKRDELKKGVQAPKQNEKPSK